MLSTSRIFTSLPYLITIQQFEQQFQFLNTSYKKNKRLTINLIELNKIMNFRIISLKGLPTLYDLRTTKLINNITK